MFSAQRVIFSDAGVLSDITATVGNFRENQSTINLVAADDAIFIGSEWPMNHRWIDITTANDQASVASVKIWWSNAWADAVDEYDGTATSGVTLARDGVLRWSTDRLKGWDREQDSADVTGLTGTAIYNMYWVKLVFSGNLKATTSIKFIGHKFCTDAQMYSHYPALNNSDLLTMFAAGKTDWNDQHYIAADMLIKDLKRRNLICSPGQIFDYELFEEAAIHKAAFVIFSGMGKGFVDQKNESAKEYEKAISLKQFRFDDGDGIQQVEEKFQTTGWLSR